MSDEEKKLKALMETASKAGLSITQRGEQLELRFNVGSGFLFDNVKDLTAYFCTLAESLAKFFVDNDGNFIEE